MRKKKNKNGEEMSVPFADSLARFVFYQIASRFGSFIEKSRRETEGFLCDSNPLGRSKFRGNIPRKRPDKMALTKEDRSYGNSFFYGIRMLRSIFSGCSNWNSASEKRFSSSLCFYSHYAVFVVFVPRFERTNIDTKIRNLFNNYV